MEKETGMTIEEEIKAYVSSELLRESGSSRITEEDALISSGRVDSMGLLQILGFIQQRFGIDLMAVGNPEDFDTIQGLAGAVRRNQRTS
jgi:acyl carrier protein